MVHNEVSASWNEDGKDADFTDNSTNYEPAEMLFIFYSSTLNFYLLFKAVNTIAVYFLNKRYPKEKYNFYTYTI